MKIAMELLAAGIGTVLTAVAFWIIVAFFRAGEAASRAQARAIERVMQLKPGRVSRELGWELNQTPPEAEFVNQLAQAFREAGGEIFRHDSDQLVVYFGSRSRAKVDGLWTPDLLASPTRIVARTGDFGGRLWLQVRLDEDFGFQVFLGSVRKRFHDRYHQVFDRMTEIITPAIERYQPKKIRILF